ncbi:MAG TPA: aminoglycoside phosphotransferase family protein [Streptosporangiaceae bacterium]|nr:aminoglycoside phosphotransferase family protein [Streptosporangiaceae bacterium]
MTNDRVTRMGNTVRRPAAFWSQAVHGLLRYLESACFPAPRVLPATATASDGDSASQPGTETLTWIEGTSGADGWANVVPESGLQQWARFLRRYHDTVAGCRPPATSVWSSGQGTCAPGEIICHGDFGPWNTVWQNGEIAGLIDWDHARPAPPRPWSTWPTRWSTPPRSATTRSASAGSATPPRPTAAGSRCSATPTASRSPQTSAPSSQSSSADLARGIEPQATWVRDGHLAQLQARIAWTEASGL